MSLLVRVASPSRMELNLKSYFTMDSWRGTARSSFALVILCLLCLHACVALECAPQKPKIVFYNRCVCVCPACWKRRENILIENFIKCCSPNLSSSSLFIISFKVHFMYMHTFPMPYPVVGFQKLEAQPPKRIFRAVQSTANNFVCCERWTCMHRSAKSHSVE